MLYRDPKCVYVANDFGRANIVVSWLAEHGIDAEVMNQATMGGMINPLLTPATGIEVWVIDPAQGPEAVRLLAEHEMSLIATQALKEQAGPPLTVVCEECGKASRFPAQERGTVQNCPHCAAYLDVESPDGEEMSEPSDTEEFDDEGRRSDAITDKGPGRLRTP